jgi:hypothetical protein
LPKVEFRYGTIFAKFGIPLLKFLYSADAEVLVPLDSPDHDNDHRQEGSDSDIGSGSISGKTKKEKIQQDPNSAGLSKKINDDSSTTPAGQDTTEITEKVILDVTETLAELKRLGLEPSSLKEFTIALHRLAVASGVSPNVLSSIIKDVNSLFEGKRQSLDQVHRQIRQLRTSKDSISREIEDLDKKKQSLEVDLRLKELEYSASTQTLSEYLRIKSELERYELSITDISKLVTLINSAAEQLGSNISPSLIVETLADLKSRQDKRREIELEIENLVNSKKMLQDRLLNLEREISNRQQTINSAEELKKMGFDFNDLDKLKSVTKMIAQTRNIDETAAKNQLLSDIEGYYANDHELRKRIRLLESLLEEKEDKFKMLEQDYENEKAILDSTKKLISEGFDRRWIEKLQTVIEAYGVDLDLLSEELKQQQSLKASINKLQQIKTTLEEEERLIRQKVVAAEDQRIRTLALINEMMMKSSTVATDSTTLPSGEDDWELGELVKVAQGKDSIDEAKFRLSAQKAIEIICGKLQRNNPVRVVLEHALLALRYETSKRGRNTVN